MGLGEIEITDEAITDRLSMATIKLRRANERTEDLLCYVKRLMNSTNYSFVICGKASRSMAHKMSVRGGGGAVVLLCHLGKSS